MFDGIAEHEVAAELGVVEHSCCFFFFFFFFYEIAYFFCLFLFNLFLFNDLISMLKVVLMSFFVLLY